MAWVLWRCVSAAKPSKKQRSLIAAKSSAQSFEFNRSTQRLLRG
jgi:hypothetical protein